MIRVSRPFIFNMDETWISRDEKRTRVIVPREWREAPTLAYAEKVMHITMVMCVSADGSSLPTTAILPIKNFPADLEEQEDLFCWSGTDSGWITNPVYERWVQNVFIPYLNIKRIIHKSPDCPALLYLDGHSTRYSVVAEALFHQHNVKVIVIPPHTSHVLQPLDCGVNRIFKEKLSTYFKKPKGGGNPEMRAALISAAARANHSAMDPYSVRASFAHAGLYPLNPSVILNDPTKVSEGTYTSETPKSGKRGISIEQTVVITEPLLNTAKMQAVSKLPCVLLGVPFGSECRVFGQ